MKKPFTLLALLAAMALALPASAAAEYLIPDGNSAVNQYTEGIPTGGGERATDDSREDDVEPSKTLGPKNAQKLESKGEEGKAAAELAAETAPPIVVPEDENGNGGAGGKQNGKGDQSKGSGSADDDSENGSAVALSGSGPGSSSGLGQLISAATGGSDGSIGPLLPLAILAALAWGIVYTVVRRRDHTPEPSARP